MTLTSDSRRCIGAVTGRYKGYNDSTARRVIEVYSSLQQLEDVVTISAVAKRSQVSRSTARAVLRQECGWTQAQSRRAHRAGIQRGQLVQAAAGHQGLARGRETMELQGWPNLQQSHRSFEAMGYPALQHGRTTQAAQGWQRLVAAQASQAITGYAHLEKGRANLAARGWPNWKQARALLQEQEYIPVLEAQRRRQNEALGANDRRLRRGRSTRLAIVSALAVLQGQKLLEPVNGRDVKSARQTRLTGHEIAAYLHLHPTTVNGHLQQLRRLGLIDSQNVPTGTMSPHFA